jgi:uncharacterized protein
MNRRSFLKKTSLGLAGIGLSSGLYAWQIEPFCLEFVSLKMPIKHLPKHLLGKSLMQISDIHIGRRFDYQYVIDAFEKAKLLAPDFVVYTGDYVSTYKDEVLYDDLAKVLAHLPKGKLGTFAILGNHDYGRNFSQNHVADKIAQMLEDEKVQVLRNAQFNCEGLNFIGFDDYWGTNFAPEKAMQNLDVSQANIALCHNPDVCDLPIWGDFQSWILSGHTHGGQVKAPFLPPPMLPVKNKKYAAGQVNLGDGRTLYINRALGHLWQVRFNVRPEISIFELQEA